MNKKYEILNGNDAEFIECYGRTLYRIRALKDFDNVKAGDIGGYIESESNLSQEGDAWIYDNAKIFDNVTIYGDARIGGNAKIYDNAKIWGNASIYGDATIYDNAKIFGNARISGNAWIYGDATIYGNAKIFGDAKIYGNAKIYDNARIYGDARICGNARICGDARIYGNALIYGDARIESDDCFFMISSIGSRNDTTTFFTGADNKIYVACGCFNGDIDKFTEAVQKTHGDNIHGEMYQMAIEMAKKKLGVKV